MFSQQPWYRSYPPNVSYNPYLRPSYQSPSSFEPIPARNSYQYGLDEDRARALAEQRARRAQYLPDEVEEDDDDWGYNQFSPRERAYLEARRRQEMLERMKQEEEAARQRALEEQKWQKGLEQRQREDQEARHKLLEERKRQLRLKREEEARKQAEEREKRQQELHTRRDRSRSNAREQRRSPPRQQATSIPIHVHCNSQSSIHSPSSPSESSIPVPETEQSTAGVEGSSRPVTPRTPPPPKSPSPISRHSLEEQNEAASRIQNRYRIHTSLRSLDNFAAQFETLKKNFVYPRTIDFQKPGSDGGHISVGAYRPPSDFDNEDEMQPMDVDGPEGKLDYTSTNFALNSYMDSLDKLLMKLDGVESWGRKEIRMKRRNVVKTIEKEVSKVDRYWKQAWVDYLVKQASESKIGDGERANIPITSQSPTAEDSPSQQESSEAMEE